MTKSGRGGSRRGAGRKPILNALERLEVGSRCQRLQIEIANRRQMLDYATALEEEAVPEQWQWINAIPVEERPAFLVSEEFKEHQLWMDEARSQLKRPIRKRPYGVQRRVLREISEALSQELDREIKVTFVEDCWDEYRAFLRAQSLAV